MLQEIKKLQLKDKLQELKCSQKILLDKQIKLKLEQFVGQLNAVSMRITLNELGDAMNNTAKEMTLVSNKLDTKKLQQMAKVLAKEDMKLNLI